MDTPVPEDSSARNLAVQRLQMWQRFGVTHIPRGTATIQGLETSEPTEPSVSPPAGSVARVSPPQPEIAKPEPPAVAASPATLSEGATRPVMDASKKRSKTERNQQLKVLQEAVSRCTLCDELATTRTQTVFGVGNPQARLCFFGEAPGADEDEQGEPFVGRAGQLLTRIIEACGLKREDVYILNVLKCRPPGNRNPAPEEAQNCRPFFERQLEIIQPEYICCLGAIAASTLLETKQTIGKLRGSLHDWRGIKVLATYHPAYLLRNPSAKRTVWEDMQFLMADMGIAIPNAADKSQG